MAINSKNISLKTPLEVMHDLGFKCKALRLEANLTQSGLASRSGVSLGSIKRFENSGEISLKSLLNIALVLRRLGDFDNIFSVPDVPSTLFVEKTEKQRKRGRRK